MAHLDPDVCLASPYAAYSVVDTTFTEADMALTNDKALFFICSTLLVLLGIVIFAWLTNSRMGRVLTSTV